MLAALTIAFAVLAAIIAVHGMIEVGGFLSMLPIWLFGMEQSAFMPYEMPSVAFVVAGLFWGMMRLIGAVALWKNLKWGLALSVVNCVIALALMMSLLPFGIMDGVLAGSALILMLSAHFGTEKIVEE